MCCVFVPLSFGPLHGRQITLLFNIALLVVGYLLAILPIVVGSKIYFLA